MPPTSAIYMEINVTLINIEHVTCWVWGNPPSSLSSTQHIVDLKVLGGGRGRTVGCSTH